MISGYILDIFCLCNLSILRDEKIIGHTFIALLIRASLTSITL